MARCQRVTLKPALNGVEQVEAVQTCNHEPMKRQMPVTGSCFCTLDDHV